MFSDERKGAILNLLSHQQRITVADLAATLDVSESTVRRDLQDLEEQGMLKRTHGGAVPAELAAFEPSVQEKSQLFAKEKSQIAELVRGQVSSGDTILLDAGTTTLEIAKQLPEVPLTVFTNSLEIGLELSKHKKVSPVIIGGDFRSNTGALVGSFATLMLSQLNVDKLFLAANGIDCTRGITTANALEAMTKQAMIATAREVYLVADHSKFEQIHMVQVCGFENLHYVITDKAVPKEYEKTFDSYKIRTITPQS